MLQELRIGPVAVEHERAGEQARHHLGAAMVHLNDRRRQVEALELAGEREAGVATADDHDAVDVVPGLPRQNHHLRQVLRQGEYERPFVDRELIRTRGDPDPVRIRTWR